MIVLDTNVLSELIKPGPDPHVLSWVDGCASSELEITAITAAELRAGVAVLPRGRRKALIGQQIEALLTETFAGHVLGFDVEASSHYAAVLAARRRVGRPISALDAQIAAICQAHGAALATRNVADFAHTGVDVVDPWHS